MRSPRILIVEDDVFVALDLEMIVSREREAEVIAVNSVAAAARAAERVDMAILDIDVVDGKTYELARALEERRTPFIFVSASRRDELPAELGDKTFIPKPYDPDAVIRAVQRTLEARRDEEARRDAADE